LLHRMKYEMALSFAAAMAFNSWVVGQIQTGQFSAPSTTAFLSVDINGGSWSNNSASSPTEGWNQSFSASAYSPDPYGVSWTGWGGPTYDFGDGTQLPNGTLGVYASSNTKTFTGLPSSVASPGGMVATLSGPGTPSTYTLNGTGTLNSEDDGTGWTAGLTGPAFDIDVWRDSVSGEASFHDVQSTNFLQLQLSGLKKNSSYTVSLYSYNPFEGFSYQESATAMPPQEPNFESWGWWANQTTNPGNETFTAPSDEQVGTWSGNGTPAAPAMLQVITDGQGNAYVWTWGGSGMTGDQNASISYLNGFQIGGGTSLLLGDTNGDGVVNSADLATLEANLGQTFTGIYSRGYSIGDFNGDGVVNQDDFALFQLGEAEYNSAHPSSQVPEPTSIAVIGLTAAMLHRGRRK
jgi:Dockerin type I domain